MDTLTPHNTEILLAGRHGPVAVLTLNRPAARNSLSLDLIAALHAAVNREGAARDVAAIIIRGAPPAFCAGHDLREMQARRQDADRGRAFFERVVKLLDTLDGNRTPSTGDTPTPATGDRGPLPPVIDPSILISPSLLS